jgi:hypothetical protein
MSLEMDIVKLFESRGLRVQRLVFDPTTKPMTWIVTAEEAVR